MTMSRTEDISTRFDTWLDRYVVPRHLQGNDPAMQAEVNALLHPVLRFAPKEGWAHWLDGVLAGLDARMKTRAWPTVAEVTAACQSAVKTAIAEGSVRHEQTSAVRVIANKMLAGEAVGDQWLYGRCAVELERSGLVARDRMTAYRSALFFNWKNFYGEDVALEMEREAKARHEEADHLGPIRPPGVRADKPPRGPVRIPTNSMHTPAPVYDPVDDLTVIDEPRAPTHWTETVAPDSQEMEHLRQARMNNPLSRAAMGLPPLSEAGT